MVQAESYFKDVSPLIRPAPDVDKRMTRYLFLALNVIEPSRIRQALYLTGGGKEVSTAGLTRTNRFIRRGRFTPLEVSFEPVPRGMEPESGAEVFELPLPKTEGIPAAMLSANPLVAVVTYPGDELPQLLMGSPNTSRGLSLGITEIAALRGHQYQAQTLKNGLSLDPDIWAIQREIFPQYPTLPVLLDELRSLAERASRTTGAVKEVALDVLSSCELGEIYASTVVEDVHGQMRDPSFKTVRRYTEVELSLLEQLGIPRQDEEMKRTAQQQRQTMHALETVGARDDSLLVEVVRELKESSAEDRRAFMDFLREQRTLRPKAEKKTRIKREAVESSEDE